MMLKTEDDSLNTLRVVSHEGPGLVYYQGVTSRTTLSTAEKSTQTIPGRKKKQPPCKTRVSTPHTAVNPVSKDVKQEDGKTNYKPENEAADSPGVKGDLESEKIKHPKRVTNHKKSIPSWQRSVATCSSRDEPLPPNDGPSSTTTARRSSLPDKTLLPLPNVSWNEMARVDEGPRSSSCLPVNNSWLTNHRIPRPHTAGPRVIVPLKHTCPVGLNKEDVIRGTRLCSHNVSHSDINNEDLSTGSDTKVSCSSKQTSGKIIPVKDDGPRMLFKPSRARVPSTKMEALELTITSIQPECFTYHPPEENNSDSDNQAKDENTPKPNKNNNNSSPFIGSYNFNTMEGIRKSYRRAQSAPPSHHRHDKIQCGTNTSTENPPDQKQFSNLYWRAKSAYHKRLEATSEEDIDDRQGEDHKNVCQNSNTKHTLLRPLLRVDSEIKHSAGCPYKCKGCFKACLVSEDYVQKAIAKAIKESENPIEIRNERRFRTVPKSDIVKEALGRSQPLFQHVYGGGKVRGRIKIRPWPTYGWMDLKMKKDDEGRSGETKSKESESGDSKSTTSSGGFEENNHEGVKTVEDRIAFDVKSTLVMEGLREVGSGDPVSVCSGDHVAKRRKAPQRSSELPQKVVRVKTDAESATTSSTSESEPQ